MNRSLALWPFVAFSRLTRAVVGDLTWKPPGWIIAITRRPLLSGGLLFAILLSLGGGWRLWSYYAHLPTPPTIGWIITMDDFPQPDVQFNAQNVTLSFSSSVA